ncbi:sensor histidine kinase [Nocardia shimofusensis]|uniref:sensor histidine kinase n=1 Tax=Nocardia shimofusensis TaxID=228596 RepID=UPI0009FE04DB|nr:histidine kinase [Nocardia shimofusensis]
MDVLQATAAGVGPAVPFRSSGSVRDRLAAFVRHPIAVSRRNLEELPFDYPPAVLLCADLAFLVISVIAVVQRHEYFPTLLPLLALVVVHAPVPLFCLLGVTPRPTLLAGGAMVATALFLLQPVPSDFAPFVLVLAVGEVAAIAPKRYSAPFAVLAVAELAVFDLGGRLAWSDSGEPMQGLLMYTAGVALGWMVGVMLRYQRHFLYQERESQSIRAAQAADEERRRIAREVHDVIAHSLSVTLLHLTAARHALQTDRDVDEAVEALVDAERLGRQAMADIRRTVGLLGDRRTSHLPEPGVRDLPDLVADFAKAGLRIDHVRLDEHLDAVSAAVGLALYRIGQESLANVVKHAPDATVAVELRVRAGAATLRVDNTLSGGPAVDRGGGMGLAGMRQRADLLGGELCAGPADEGWSVRARFPLNAGARASACRIATIDGGFATQTGENG